MAKAQHIFRFDEKHELLARELYQAACCNGEPILRAAGSLDEVMKDAVRMRTFYHDVHVGFDRAQGRIVERLVALEKEPPLNDAKSPFLGEEILLRKVADSIAWQMLGGQLYIARRLHADQKPPRLTTSNYATTLTVARQYMEPDYSKAALMADITTFIQVTDLVVLDTNTGELSFTEVKEGKKNHQYLEALNEMVKAPCAERFRRFHASEGKHGVDQLLRIAKQVQKMSQVSKLLNTGTGYDPLLKSNVRIPDEELQQTTWDDRLIEALKKSADRGWAIDVIEGVLFLGVYRGNMVKVGAGIFHAWFTHSVGGQKFPIVNLMQCMTVPLALPIFSRQLPDEDKFNLLFGRCKIYLGINLDGLMALIGKLGIPVRWASRKETAKFGTSGNSFTIDNRAIICELNGTKMVVGDGLLLRLLFHGVSPSSIAEHVQRSLNNLSQVPDLGERADEATDNR